MRAHHVVACVIGLVTTAANASSQISARAAPGSFTPRASSAPGWFGPPPCGQWDDGTSENAIGLLAGGELGWLTLWETGAGSCLATWDAVDVAYGTPLFPGAVTNGATSRVVVYQDSDFDGDPTTGLILGVALTTFATNVDTDILNRIPLGVSISSPVLANAWTLVTCDNPIGEFPAAFDESPPTYTANAWAMGNTAGPGSLDITDLNANDVPPINLAAYGLPGNWLCRIAKTGIGTPLCFGDGTGTSCPCGNNGSLGHGCSNGSTVDGGILTASGTADVLADTMTLTCEGVTSQNGLFFQGNNFLNNGNGYVFGDGLRCCGSSLVLLQIVNPPGISEPATAQMTVQATSRGLPGTLLPGATKCYQYWYRDPAGTPCGYGFNLSNAVRITWT